MKNNPESAMIGLIKKTEKVNKKPSLIRRVVEFWTINDEEHYMSLFTKILLLFLLLFFIWAAFAPINSSIIASGEIVLSGNKKIISHLEGGIIDEIKIKESQLVTAGEDLIILNTIQVKSKIRQVEEGIHAAKFQKTATEKRIATLKNELEIVNQLLKNSNSSMTRKLELQKQFHESEGKLGELISNISSFESELRAANDTLERSVIKAPTAGKIMNLKYQTIGGIITPASEIMFIVPQDDKLVAEVKVSPQDIDLLKTGMGAYIQLTAYKSKLMPKLNGKVIGISADNFKNEMTGEIYFKSRIEIPESELKKLKQDIKLTPGMPVQSFIITGSRTMLQYMFNPIQESAYRAFREE